jgi:hypothetical protein
VRAGSVQAVRWSGGLPHGTVPTGPHTGHCLRFFAFVCGSTLHGAASGIGDAHAFADCPAQAADQSWVRSAGSRVL